MDDQEKRYWIAVSGRERRIWKVWPVEGGWLAAADEQEAAKASGRWPVVAVSQYPVTLAVVRLELFERRGAEEVEYLAESPLAGAPA